MVVDTPFSGQIFAEMTVPVTGWFFQTGEAVLARDPLKKISPSFRGASRTAAAMSAAT
jgi:hypothetical protein